MQVFFRTVDQFHMIVFDEQVVIRRRDIYLSRLYLFAVYGMGNGQA
jgi:hypothetical protein